MKARLILASSSPRRKQLLADAGFPVQVCPPSVTEVSAPWLTVRECVLLNAQRKCAQIAAQRPRDIVIAADTLVSLEGTPFGKPADLAEAYRMLARLSGREHQVYTGVCIAGGKHARVSFVEETKVTFRPLTRDQIDDYFLLIDPLDKAGAYAAQQGNDRVIAGIVGSKTNVIGLPMEKLKTTLARDFQIEPVSAAAAAS